MGKSIKLSAVRGWEKKNMPPFASLLASLDNPHEKFPSIHIAGTNGKGSVALKTAVGLRKAGLKVGLYMSPHLDSPCERIRINADMVSEQDIAKLPEGFSFFEGMTARAFEIFAREKVDIAVIECGLGGRLCPTNAITPLISVITSLSLDHEERLGNTLDAIAREKGGIIKSRVPLVLGAKAQHPEVIAKAKAQQAPLICGIMSDGFFDHENNEIASLVLQKLKAAYPITDAMICEAMHMRPRCRFEVLQGFGPTFIVLDIAHNPDGMRHLAYALKTQLPTAPVRIAINLGRRKNHAAILAEVGRITDHVHLLTPSHPELTPPEELLPFLPNAEIHTPMEVLLEKTIHEGEILVFTGSAYMMAEVRQSLSVLAQKL